MQIDDPFFITNLNSNVQLFHVIPLIEVFKGVSASFLLVHFLCLKKSTCKTRKNAFFYTFKAFCSQENQRLEFYTLKFHDVIKCLSVKQVMHFTKKLVNTVYY